MQWGSLLHLAQGPAALATTAWLAAPQPHNKSAPLAPSPLQLDQCPLRRASSALAATSVLQALFHGLTSTAAEAATALPALAPLSPAPIKCPQLADGALLKSKALHSMWKQRNVSITASGTLHQATARSANARPLHNVHTYFAPLRHTLQGGGVLSPSISAGPHDSKGPQAFGVPEGVAHRRLPCISLLAKPIVCLFKRKGTVQVCFFTS